METEKRGKVPSNLLNESAKLAFREENALYAGNSPMYNVESGRYYFGTYYPYSLLTLTSFCDMFPFST